MMATNTGQSNFRVILKSRPGINEEPQEENFGVEEYTFPDEDSLAPGELLIKNLFLSVDPALRCRMNEESGVHYMTAWELGQPVDGLGGVGKVMASRDPNFQESDLVCATFLWPWALYFTIAGCKVEKVSKELIRNSPSLVLSLLGGTGLTAYLGIAEKGHIDPQAGQTVVISAAAGATGSLAGQIAKLFGAKNVVGICGSDEKCQFLKEELEFNSAINYKAGDIASKLSQACPEGVHVYFDNVGGELSTAVIKQMQANGHVILCGQISLYNTDLPYPPPISPELQQIIQERNITRERFLVLDYADKFEQALRVLTDWHVTGKIKVKETVVEGLANAGRAFVSMMQGGNIGKQIVSISPS